MSDVELKIKRSIEEADLVLIGLGTGFEYDWHDLLDDARYQEIEKDIADREEYRWIVPFLQKMVLRSTADERLMRAYEKLQKLVNGKNYFLVSLCMDDYVYRFSFQEERVVTPCGGFRKMQCDGNCSRILQEVPENVYEDVLAYYQKKKQLNELHEPVCEKCGASLRFNQIGVTHYAEEGYLQEWDKYTKWLTGTVNRKVCVLELGAGMEYPSVIRFPFEKIVFYNKKAELYRIHPFLYQIGEEIADRGMGVKADPVKFLGENAKI